MMIELHEKQIVTSFSQQFQFYNKKFEKLAKYGQLMLGTHD